jgi:16S rRNA (uracil1498-N3)-methyltransferase
MECLYLPDFRENDFLPEISLEERKHLKALRIKENDEIMITNGIGLSAITKIHFDKNWNPYCEILEFIKDFGEIEFNFSLLVCNLHNKERMEIIVEKGSELGATELFIPVCNYSQTDKIDLQRLQKIAIVAMKQSKRSKLLKITPITPGSDYFDIFKSFKNVVLLDEQGNKPYSNPIYGDSIILVGPEGGFHHNELSKFDTLPNLSKWYLGKRRLRTETAALKALSIITSMNE